MHIFIIYKPARIVISSIVDADWKLYTSVPLNFIKPREGTHMRYTEEEAKDGKDSQR